MRFQLTTSIKQQVVFAGYSEGPLVFRPTYKYDNNSDVYDTSEKQRIPSWTGQSGKGEPDLHADVFTDRILYKGAGLSLKEYNRAELRLSDHRPGEPSEFPHTSMSSQLASICDLQSKSRCDRSREER